MTLRHSPFIALCVFGLVVMSTLSTFSPMGLTDSMVMIFMIAIFGYTGLGTR